MAGQELAKWLLDEGGGATLVDSAGNGRHLGIEVPTWINVSTGAYDALQDFNVGVEVLSTVTGMFISVDGLHLYAWEFGEIFEYDLSVPFDASTAVYSGNSKNVSLQAGFSSGFWFDATGVHMYALDITDNVIYQYLLSTGFDVSTAAYTGKIFNATPINGDMTSLTLSTDGTRAYLLSTSSLNEAVFSLTLSTPYDISTASDDGKMLDITGEATTARSITLGPSGETLLVMDTPSDTLYQYTFSTPYDLDTASYDSEALVVTTESTQPFGAHANVAGDKVWVVDGVSKNVYAYEIPLEGGSDEVVFGRPSLRSDNVGNAIGMTVKPDLVVSPNDFGTGTWDVQDATVDTDTDQAPDNSVTADKLTGDGAGLYPAVLLAPLAVTVAGGFRGAIYLKGGTAGTAYVMIRDNTSAAEATLVLAVDLTFGVVTEEFRQNCTGGGAARVVGDGWFYVSIEVQFSSIAIGDEVQFGPLVAWNATSTNDIRMWGASFKETVNTVPAEGNFALPYSQGLTIEALLCPREFSNDGVDQKYPGVASHNATAINTLWDLGADNYNGSSFDVTGQDIGPRELAFNTDGTKMFVMGGLSDKVYQYTLGTGFDVSTATSAGLEEFDVSNQDTIPLGLTFSADGKKMYVVGAVARSIFQYTLGVGFDLTTATEIGVVEFDVEPQTSTPYGMTFNADGTKMYVVGGQQVFQYALAIGFDVSTAGEGVVSFLADSAGAAYNGIAFSTNGSRLFLVGGNTDTVYQYPLSIGFDLATASETGMKSTLVRGEAPTGIALDFRGGRMFVAGGIIAAVDQYRLHTLFDIGETEYDNAPKFNFTLANQGQSYESSVSWAARKAEVRSQAPANVNQVYHLVATIRPSTDTIELWVDGLSMGVDSYNPGLWDDDPASTLIRLFGAKGSSDVDNVVLYSQEANQNFVDARFLDARGYAKAALSVARPINLQQGDVLLVQARDNGNIFTVNGIVEMTGGFETAAYLSLFGGNEDGTEYWGDIGVDDPAEKYTSETQQVLHGLPASSANLLRLRDAVKLDLQWFLDKNIANTVAVLVTIPALNAVNIAVRITAEGQEQDFMFTENWRAAQ